MKVYSRQNAASLLQVHKTQEKPVNHGYYSANCLEAIRLLDPQEFPAFVERNKIVTSPEGSHFLSSLGLSPDEIAIRKTNKTRLKIYTETDVIKTDDNVMLWTLGSRVKVVSIDGSTHTYDNVIKVLEIREVWYNRV